MDSSPNLPVALTDAQKTVIAAFPETHQRLIWALIDPLDFRTEAELCTQLAVTHKDINELKRNRAFRTIANDLMDKAVADSRWAILKALLRAAISKGDTNAQRMALERLGDYSEKHEVRSVSISVFRNLNDDDLKKRVRQLEDDIEFYDAVEVPAGERVLADSSPPGDGDTARAD
jgi:hypothetical protein